MSYACLDFFNDLIFLINCNMEKCEMAPQEEQVTGKENNKNIVFFKL